MRSFFQSAGLGISNECPAKERVQGSIEGVVEQSISHCRLVDTARLGIGDAECLIRRMSIAFGCKISVQQNNVGHEVMSEFLNIFSRPLSIHKLSPCLKEIFKRNDMMVRMSILSSHSTTHSTPPPTFATTRESESCLSCVVWALSSIAETPQALPRPEN